MKNNYMEVAVPRRDPSFSDTIDLNRYALSGLCMLGAVTCGLSAVPSAVTMMLTCYVNTLRSIQESWEKEFALAEFRTSINQRDFFHAEELYDRHTTTGFLKGAQKSESILVSVWTEEATRFLRMSELRGKIQREDIVFSFPRCLSREDPTEDVRFIVGAIKEISSSLFKESDRARLLEDLESTEIGRTALETFRATPRTVLQQHYASFLS